jgi:hypothetical protein
MVANVKGRVAVNKRGLHRFLMERFDLKEKYRVEVSNKIAALEDLDSEVETWETIRQNIKMSKRV